MDALSTILEAVRIRGSVYFWANLSPPWGVKVPVFERVVRYHLILRGHCWVRVHGVPEPIRLEAGDLVAIPHGRAHLLSDGPRTACVSLDRVLEQTRFAGEGALVVGNQDAGSQTRMVCGHFAHDADEEHPLFRALPDTIVVRGVAGSDVRWLDEVLRYIAREVAANGPGTTAIVTRLSEILFVHTLRSYAAEHPEHGVGWAGFVDPWIGPALARIHDAPGTDWSVATLARAARLSRTRFALRFRSLMGKTPLAYVARWRMICAKAELRDASRSIAEVASRVGYRSESAFNRVFTRAFGMGPGAFRRTLDPPRIGNREGALALRLKRIYAPPAPDDGVRVLVDRLWPRGLTRRQARVDHWIKDVAPSDALRRWFAHDPKKWTVFKRKYHAELRAAPHRVARLMELMGDGKVVLLYSAASERFNNAVALAEYLHRLGDTGADGKDAAGRHRNPHTLG